MLAGCKQEAAPPFPFQDATPAIWEITGADGGIEGWLFGTIHALPDNTRWRSEAVRTVIDEADLLVVEIAALEDADAIATTFALLSHTPGQPLLRERVPERLHGTLAAAIEETAFVPEDYRAIETWAAALLLARTAKTASDPVNGVDKALIREFAGRPVREVEGAREQLGVFDTLPEKEQRDLLALTLAELERPDSARQRTVTRWLAGDVEAMLDPDVETLLDDPELREVLVEGRNRTWAGRIVALLQRDARPLVAVGAGHMGGPAGLPQLLREVGYTVTRLD